MQFVVLSSSRGTTFQSVLDALAAGALEAKCLGLVSDLPTCGAVEKAKVAGLPLVVMEPGAGPSFAKATEGKESREDYDRGLVQEFERTLGRPGVIALIGWFHLLSPWFVGRYRSRILNVHPSLLPKHPGLHAHEEVLGALERESGMTIHIVDEKLDHGPVLLQRSCPVLPGDTVETLQTRVQALEKEWYPKVLQMIHTGELNLPG